MTKKEFKIYVGEKIRKIRLSRKIPIENFAEIMGTSVPFLIAIETGRRGCTLLRFTNFLKSFDINYYDFFNDDLNEKPLDKLTSKKELIKIYIDTFNSMEQCEFMVAMVRDLIKLIDKKEIE